ncbi:aspartyl protease family protein [Flavobacterium cerinum]|uniref:Retroviral-like aspartic protease family protein n=1 Tax=Flavobacterium cerinum TaxID=2502784 RepID=A0ABY5IVQ0_9FLAO|nr:aspartyl protease family protein [Flavobacterium cerinum]UUC46885.1 retroviral-like aspartic protease family protein [Flavobacterium cerinum]
MKNNFIFLLLLFATYGFSQKKLPVVKANSKSAIIKEEGKSLTKWNLDPKIKIDAYTTNKLIETAVIKLKTDIDSISIALKPGEQKDFIVLLNGKDTCYTRFQSPEVKNFNKLKPEVHDTIPMTINTKNTNRIRVVLNKADTLQLNFDTGATEIVLIEQALKNKVKSNLNLYNTFYDIKVGNQIYKSKVYDIKVAGDEADGLIGWDHFDGMIVELNYDQNIMVVHSKLPKAVKRDKTTEKFKIKYFNQKPFIEAEIVEGNTKVKDWFLFDTGYQKTVMLDNELLSKEKFPVDQMKVLHTEMMRGTKNNEIPVVTSNLQILKLGKHELKNVPAQILASNKPMPGANIHILGSDVLKRFNTFLDFQENVVYLQPNQLYDVKYLQKS